MKHFIFFLYFVGGILGAQNYHYALDNASKEPDTEAPSAPLNLVATDITGNSVNLNWSEATDNIGVVAYSIYNNGVLVTTPTTIIGNSYILTGLTPNTIYNLTIRAIDAEGNESIPSNEVTFTTLGPDIEAPSAPLDLIASNITGTTVQLDWDNATDNIDVVAYRIYNGGNLLTTPTITTNSHLLTGLIPNTTYNLTVRAVDAADNESIDSNIVTFTTEEANFFIFQHINGSNDSVVATMEDGYSNVLNTFNAFNISAITSQTVGSVTLALTGDLTSNKSENVAPYTLFGDNGAGDFFSGPNLPEGNYNLSATAWTDNGGTGILLAQENISFTVLPNAPDIIAPSDPINLVASNPTSTTIDLNWTASTDNIGVSNYRIYNNGTVLVNGTGNVTNYTLTGLASDTLYTLTVRALDAAGNESGDSNIVTISTTAPDTEAPSSPLNLVATNITHNSIDLAWDEATDNVGVTEYRIYDNGNLITTPIITNNSYRLTGLSSNTLYQITVRAFDGAGNESGDSNIEAVTTLEAPSGSLCSNTPEEIKYFDAVLVPSSNAANLQSELNTHNHIRLDSGDYSAAGNITIRSNQSIYGFPSQDGSELGSGDIIIAQGSSNVLLKDLDPRNIIFEAGSEISNVTINHIAKADIDCIGCRLTDSKIINIMITEINFNNSASGYVRNTQIIRAYAQSQNDHVRWLGNDTEPSYNNIELSRNFLTSLQNTSNYDTLESHTLLGTDSEHWDNTGTASRGPYYFRNCGQVNIFNSFGWSSPARAPEFDIEADLVWMQRRGVGSRQTPIFRTGTDVIYASGNRNAPRYEGGNFYLEAYHGDDDINFNGVNIGSTITGQDASKLRNMIYQPKYTPIAKPSFRDLCSPAGPNWSADRVGQVDQSAFIQNLIDTNGVAELDEGIYYISKPLLVKNEQGIIGKGTGKTVIVGITDDFPLIKVNDVVSGGRQSTGQNHVLSHLTLQGGSIGYHVLPVNSNLNVYMISNNTVNNVVFRNQTDGIRIEKIHGYDNNFFDNVSFVDCTNGIMQIPSTVEGVNDPDVAYVDKTVFYNCQFINNTTALNMATIRANNLNAWIDCNFDGNGVVFNTTQSNALYVANSVFKNGKGSSVMRGNARMSLYGCDFTNNSVSSLFDGKRGIYAEGCNFNDSGVDFFNSASGHEKDLYLWNSNVQSNINPSNIEKGLLINNNVRNNSTLTKPIVEIIRGTPLTILDGTVDAYPQLLVKK